jgi:flagellar P-ring protein precursor FlgI
MMRRLAVLTIWLVSLSACHCTALAGVRIKDITDFEGARNNQLYGFGLVVGLDGTGSRSLFTQQVAVDMLKKLSVVGKIFQDLPSDNVLRSGNISAVMITTEIGPYARAGSRLDITVSTLDDASSLQGGTLILTPLRGADGEVYAVAQGPISVGGFAFGGRAASVQKNHPTVGRIPGGATVEHEARGEILCQGRLRLLLKEADYESASAIGFVINSQYPGTALVLDAGTVQVALPKSGLANPVAFANEIGLLEVTPDSTARVVINERTGTIVAGEQVKISTVAIAHGNLAIVKSEEPEVSQPNPFANGRTVVVPRTKVGVTEQAGALRVVDRTITVGSLARALNALGVSPRDLISIFQALKGAGALHAELIIQ